MKFLRTVLVERNIANIEEVQRELDMLAKDTNRPDAQKWIKQTLRKWIINHHNAVQPADVNQNSPQWLINAKEKGEQVFDVFIDDNMKMEIEHIIDYFNANPNLRLNRVSVPQALRAAEEWTQHLAKKATDVEDEGGIETVMKFPGGERIVKVTSAQALNREGKLMGHCVGGYCEQVESGGTEIYSVRDKENDPHVTIEVKKGTRSIHQIKGKGNRPPISKYVPFVLDFINKTDFDIRGDESNVGLLRIGDKLYSINDIPANSIIDKYNFSVTDPVEHLADNLVFSRGTLEISSSKIKEFPKGLKVKQSLKIKGTQITIIPGDVEVGKNIHIIDAPVKHFNLTEVNGGLYIYNSEIEFLPDNLNVKGDLTLDNSRIKKLPKGLKVGEDLDLEGTDIKELPANLKVPNGHLILSETKIKELPLGLEVGGALDITDTLIRTLPKDMKISGKIYGFEGNKEDYPMYKFGHK